MSVETLQGYGILNQDNGLLAGSDCDWRPFHTERTLVFPTEGDANEFLHAYCWEPNLTIVPLYYAQ